MSENPVDDFLEKVSASRKSLTDQEKKEAMIIAGEILALAKSKLGKREVEIVENIAPNSNQKFLIMSGKEIGDYKREHPGTTLVIIALKYPQIERKYWHGKADSIKTYCFTPYGVVLEEMGLKDVKGRKHYERATMEVYHPDKADLTGLLNTLSSASVIPE